MGIFWSKPNPPPQTGLHAGPRLHKNVNQTVNTAGTNKVVVRDGYGQNQNASAGIEIYGDVMGVLNLNETNSVIAGPDIQDEQTCASKLKIHGNMYILNQGCNRQGSEIDVNNLDKTFGSTGMEVEIKRDPNYRDVVAQVDYLAKKNFTGRKLFGLVFMSHGDMNGSVFTEDAGFDLQSTVIDPIMNNRTLNGIPKIFIIVACRGSKHYELCDQYAADDGSKDLSTDARFSGVAGKAPWLIAYSTIDDHVSYRDTRKGTPYIQSLCHHMNKATGNTTVTSIFENVNTELRQKYSIQIPFFQSAMGSVCFRDLAPAQT